jgi:hypothetical protein
MSIAEIVNTCIPHGHRSSQCGLSTRLFSLFRFHLKTNQGEKEREVGRYCTQKSLSILVIGPAGSCCISSHYRAFLFLCTCTVETLVRIPSEPPASSEERLYKITVLLLQFSRSFHNDAHAQDTEKLRVHVSRESAPASHHVS